VTIPISAIAPGTAVQGEISPPVLQPGAVIDARVVQLLDSGQVRIAIGGNMIDVMAATELAVGDMLRLAVSETTQGIRLTLVGQHHGSAAVSTDARGLPLPTAPAGMPRAGGDTATAALRTAGTAETAAPQRESTPIPTPASAPATTSAVLAQAVQTAAPRQAGLAPLFANLAAATASGTLPPAVQQAAAQILALRPTLDGKLGAQDLRKAFQGSGLFLESGLARGAAPQTGAMPDLKAALVVFRQVVANWSAALAPEKSGPQSPAGTPVPAGGARPQPAADAGTLRAAVPMASPIEEILLPNVTFTASARPPAAGTPPPSALANPSLSAGQAVPAAHALALLQELQQVIGGTAPTGAARSTANLSADSMGGLLARLNDGAVVMPGPTTPQVPGQRADTPPPPFRGAAPAAQPAVAPDIAPDSPAATVARQLLDDTEGALARQTLLQVASLPEAAGGVPRPEAAGPRWHFEIPFATPNGTALAQFEVARDGHNGAASEARAPTWQARFTLNVEPAGPVHAQVLLAGIRASVRMWAERPATMAQLREGMGNLSQALRAADLEPGDIVIGEGAPAVSGTVRAGRFLDRAS
jgi:hypothetical protein